MTLFDTLTTQLAGGLGYAGVLGLLVACGMGAPVPEDVILIAGGYIESTGVNGGHVPFAMMAVGLVGILAGDSIIYWLGRHFGLPFAERTFLRRYLTKDRMERVRGLFKTHGEKMIMGARYMPGVRAVTFFVSGTMRVPYYHFLFFDGLAAMISAPLWVFLGYRFGGHVVQWAHRFQGALMMVALLLGVGLLFMRMARGRRKAEETLVPPAVRIAPGTDDA